MKPRLRQFAALVFLSLTSVFNVLSSDSATTSNFNARIDSQDFVFKSGDRIDIQIKEAHDSAMTLFISNDGRVMVPYLGFRQAVGKTRSAFEREVKAELEATYFKVATVQIQRTPPRPPPKMPSRFYIAGAVALPGTYEIDYDEQATISDLIRGAGGAKDGALLGRILILRRTPLGPKKILVNFHRIKTQESPYDVFLRNWDVVYVPSKGQEELLDSQSAYRELQKAGPGACRGIEP